MAWQLRHQGSPTALKDLSLQQIVDGLREGDWEGADEVIGPGESAWRSIESHPKLAEIAMELEVPPPARQEEPTSLDMNALIDVCLVLLIFYMITAAYVALVQKTVPVPAASTDSKGIRKVRIEEVKNSMIRMQAYQDKSGRPVVLVDNQTVSDVAASDGTKIDPDKLKAIIRPYVKGEDHKTVVLLDAHDITWENVILLQDGVRAAGVQKISYLKK